MINTLEQDVRECVQRGYDWMMTEGPQRDLLLSRVDPLTLKVDSVDACVMAQAAGGPEPNYGIGMLRALDKMYNNRGVGNTVNGQSSYAWAKSHGFMSLDADFKGQIADRIWRELLTQDVVA
jgi:hypothetical protein